VNARRLLGELRFSGNLHGSSDIKCQTSAVSSADQRAIGARTKSEEFWGIVEFYVRFDVNGFRFALDSRVDADEGQAMR